MIKIARRADNEERWFSMKELAMEEVGGLEKCPVSNGRCAVFSSEGKKPGPAPRQATACPMTFGS